MFLLLNTSVIKQLGAKDATWGIQKLHQELETFVIIIHFFIHYMDACEYDMNTI
jgi:hypothetical protein